MNKFIIEIPNERIKTYRIVMFIILTLNFLGFGYIFLQSKSSSLSILTITGLIINAVPWIYFLLNKKHFRSPGIEVTMLLSAFLWIYFGNIWMGILLLFFALIGYFANKKLVIVFSDEGIIYPSFPVKKYSWKEVERVIRKDDILTIDLKNNKLMQFNIDKDIATKSEVEGFNNACSKKTSENNSQI